MWASGAGAGAQLGEADTAVAAHLEEHAAELGDRWVAGWVAGWLAGSCTIVMQTAAAWQIITTLTLAALQSQT
jgi:hypothetical protein